MFIRVAKQGSTLSGIMDAFSIAVSLGLQHDVPLSTFVEKLSNIRFEPAGMTDDQDIRMASSIVDYFFRRLALDYIPARRARRTCGRSRAWVHQLVVGGPTRETTQVATQIVEEPSVADVAAAVRTLKLVADETRLRIIWNLLHGEHSVNELARHLDMQPAAVSHHLAKLRLAGVVSTRRDGNHIHYAAHDDHIEALVQEALRHVEHLDPSAGHGHLHPPQTR